jgi:tetratricopeptide (TPR) repeat protein
MDRKPSSRRSPQKRKSNRRWHLAPVIKHGPEPLESARLLDEDPSPTGLLLWQMVRDVHLWASAEPEERDRLFAGGSESLMYELIEQSRPADEIVSPIHELAVQLGRGGAAEVDRLAEACLSIASWGSETGKPVTALSFAQAASLSRPDHASDANRVALLAQELGEHARAETWFRRTVTVARQSDDREAYALGLVGLGRLYRLRGSPRVAQRFFVRAHRAAIRWGLRPIRVTVLHELFGVAVELERFMTAEQYARATFEQSTAGEEILAELPSEVARLWLARGAYAEARQVLEAVRSAPQLATNGVLGIADLVWALGGLGDRGAFEKAWGHAWEELGGVKRATERARALLSLSNGAALMHDAGRALHAAEQAGLAARESGDRKIRQVAETTLRALREGEPIPALASSNTRGTSTLTRTFAQVLVRSIAPGDASSE